MRNTTKIKCYESAEADMMGGWRVGAAFKGSKAKVVRHNRRRHKDKEGKVRTFTTERGLYNKC